MPLNYDMKKRQILFLHKLISNVIGKIMKLRKFGIFKFEISLLRAKTEENDKP
jgi:hypothetical protein